MRSFKDTNGTEWEVSINVNAIKRVREVCKVNLLDIVEGGLVQKLMADPVVLCDVIYVLCKPQADERKISDEDFGRAMAGDAIDAALRGLLEELVDFSPSPRDRTAMKKAMKMIWETMDATHDIIEERLPGELKKIAADALSNAKNSFGAAPESSDSTPASSPSAS